MIKEIIERLQYIDILIQEHKTGTAADLAQTIGVSERTIHRTIKHMKKLGAPIAFNLLTKSYYYKQEGRFVCAFSFTENMKHSEKVELTRSKLSVKNMKEFIEIMNATLGLNNN